MKSILCYDKPADFDKWEQQALVIGNGYLGASFFGGTALEKITLNEKTLWTGGPSSSRRYNGGNAVNRYPYVKSVQGHLAAGRYDKATNLLPMLTSGGEDGFGAYQCLCDIYIEFDGIYEVENYERRLNMSSGVITTTFKSGGVSHKRVAFANYPNNVICVQLSTDKFKLRLDNIQEGGIVTSDEHGLLYKGALTDNGLRYAVALGVDKNCIYITAATDYSPAYPYYRSGVNPECVVSKRLRESIEKGSQVLLNQHIEDFGNLFNRVKIDLGETNIIYEQFFQFGRYLLISSSRKGSLPANLQGIWNESNNPPWNCDYHINVNLQMNYWLAHNTNLAETVPPLVDFLDAMRKPGRVTAKEYYGVEFKLGEENGWVAHTQTNPFGWTAPGWGFYWGWSTAAVAWLMQNLWEYYEFTLDVEYLKERIYPIMREAVMFYKQWLIYDDKQERLVSSPSYSPEHGPVTIGNVYEQCLIEQFYSDFIKASEVLGLDKDLCNEIKAQHKLLKPYKIGEKLHSGCLLEWFEQEDDSFDTSKVEERHRHISHLLGLYPGKSINKNTPELLKAAVKVMNGRGNGSTGWARAFKTCLWARSGDGENAYKVLSGLISDCTYQNMFSFHPPFQIDGNLGGCAGIAEMLLQSHENYIELFPAIPKSWKNVKFIGLCARGGFIVDAEMKNCKVIKARIVSKIAKKSILCHIKINGEIMEFTMEENGEWCYNV